MVLLCFLVGLTVPAGLFGPVSVVLPVPSSPVSIRMSLPAAAPWTPALLPAQVKEELSGRLLNRERGDFSKGNYITHRNKCKAKAALNIFSINKMFSMTQDRYLLRCAAEALLLFVRLVFGRMFVRAFCHVLRLLHQL